MLFGTGSGGSTSTGLTDTVYYRGTTVAGEREWQSLGILGFGYNGGLWYVRGNDPLSIAYWYSGSRLSAIGRAS